MKTAGIIAEYNPFHNGHAYHIKRAKEITGADCAVIVMSGDYAQRGIPAIYEKHLRTKTALSCGADLVVEMPVFGVLSGAMDFAHCGVSLLHHMGITDVLCFGSETGDLMPLREQADALSRETPEISQTMKKSLKEGLSWPAAREKAYGVLLSSPNDILAVEYLRAIKRLSSPMAAAAVKREGPGYHSEKAEGDFASATAARKAISAQDTKTLKQVLPEIFFRYLKEEPASPVFLDDFSQLLSRALLVSTPEQLGQISQMPGDLAKKLYNNRLSFLSASERTALMKNRQYTYTRVNRCLMNTALGITKEETAAFKAFDSAPWIRILGFRSDASPLLSALKQKADRPLITKTADGEEILKKFYREPDSLKINSAASSSLPDAASTACRLFQKQLETSEIYRLIAETKAGRSMKNEYTRPIVIV